MKNNTNLSIVFFGTPEFAAIVLERLDASPYKPAFIVTTPDMPAGRKQILNPPPVKLYAEKLSIPVFQPATRKELQEGPTLRGGSVLPARADLFIVAAYGKILPKEILKIPKYGTLNVHPSLLPRWRGASPIQSAILAGDKETGASIILMDARMDHGPVLAQKKWPIAVDATTESLSMELANFSAELLLETIPEWLEGRITPIEQDHEKAVFCKPVSKENARIDWNKSAEEIERMVRAYTPWPGTFTLWDGKRIIIHSARVANSQQENLEPGKVIAFENTLAIQAGANILIPVLVQYEGKKEQSAQEFLRGHSQIIGAILK
ncbi:MAG: methionyl-tRNA formyltransferase [Candidatus Spechtbacteria bacterium]|nr:methionyl-tRNA formyltransferase [Candidatus Spechtbacteria bacterium]